MTLIGNHILKIKSITHGGFTFLKKQYVTQTGDDKCFIHLDSISLS